MNRQIHRLKNSQKWRIKRRKIYYENFLSKKCKELIASSFSENSDTIKERNRKYGEGLHTIEWLRKQIITENFVELDFSDKNFISQAVDKKIKELMETEQTNFKRIDPYPTYEIPKYTKE
jgi:ribosomal 50S subunit-associated protein YjgA (DUF615 family)